MSNAPLYTSGAGDAGQFFVKYDEWDGKPETFESWYLSVIGRTLDPTMANKLGSACHICVTLYGKIPSLQRSPLTPYIRSRLMPKMDEDGKSVAPPWVVSDFLAITWDAFQPKDLMALAQRKIFTIRQGDGQHLADYRSVWDSLVANAQELAPQGAAAIQVFKTSLRKGMVEALAVRGGVSATDWDSFIRTTQSLATDLESLPNFGLTGSKKEWYTTDKTTFVNTNNRGGAELTQQAQRTPVLDHDGDTRMSGVNAIGSVTDIQSMAAAIIAAISNGRSSQGRSGNGGGFRDEHRPHPPPVSMEVRAARMGAHKCERCGASPSHPWGQCQYRNFKESPTPHGGGYGRTPSHVGNVQTGKE